jgi:hypothetical protein
MSLEQILLVTNITWQNVVMEVVNLTKKNSITNAVKTNVIGINVN